MKEFFDKYKYVIGVVAVTVGLLGTLGYNVRASMPPTRSEVSDMVEPISTELKEVRQLAQANTDWIALQRWTFLNTKRNQQGLAPDEQYEYCGLSRYLGFQVQGCS